MKDEYIRKDDALACIEGYREKNGSIVSPDELPEYQKIEALPAADVRENRRGQWIYGEDERGIDGYHCNKCGFFVTWDYPHDPVDYINDYNFCPNCGADLRGEENRHEPNDKRMP